MEARIRKKQQPFIENEHGKRIRRLELIINNFIVGDNANCLFQNRLLRQKPFVRNLAMTFTPLRRGDVLRTEGFSQPLRRINPFARF